MNTLDRYLAKEIALPFAIGLGLFFVVVAFAQVLQVSDSVTGLGITGAEILSALMYSLPPLMGLLIPVSGLFATLLGVGRLAADREVIALCACGISPYRILRVPLFFGVILAAASGYALIVGEPWGVRGLRDLMSRSAQRALASGVRSGEFQQWVPGVTFIASGKKHGELQEVVFADRRDEQKPLLISARRGTVQGGQRARDIIFELKDGVVLVEDKEKSAYRAIHFEKSLYRLDVGRLVTNKARTLTSVQEKSLVALWQGSHNKAFKKKERAQFSIALHRKLALPLATIIFALLAVPLACRATGGARARGFLISAGIVGAYYYLGRALELLARGGDFHPALAAWMPDIIGTIALVIMLVRFKRTAV